MEVYMTLKTQAYDLIKDRIMRCEYQQGTFICENDLMEELKISRTPIREAIIELEKEGFVRILPKKGIVVQGLTISDINNTFEVRLLVEPYVIRNYTNTIKTEDLMKYRELSNTLLQNAEDASPQSFANLDDQFHRLIGLSCSNTYLTEMLGHIYDQNIRIRQLCGSSIYKRHIEACQEHIDIINYILDRHIDEAAASMTYHIIKSKEAAVMSFVKGKIYL